MIYRRNDHGTERWLLVGDDAATGIQLTPENHYAAVAVEVRLSEPPEATGWEPVEIETEEEESA